ncbi:hypothetical protein SADUNF_Sadunf17G0023900 [Salix dunnii]|uniref:B box-type domain-containing protein n=1 Tax=Salix dunnii TaxID=1413687 RepID=A0A835MMY1_9ROSI|nr:hypothetical protein SADUNF_Sadunf17G0023900 [Salix dunnii]
MCRGIKERNNQGSSCNKDAVSPNPTSRLVCCELCGSRATLYCEADHAFLCQKCDKWVHGANFLALRHVRNMLCNTCQNRTQRCLVGATTERIQIQRPPQLDSWKKEGDTDRINGNPEKYIEWFVGIRPGSNSLARKGITIQ